MHLILKRPDLRIEDVESCLRRCLPEPEYYYPPENIHYSERIAPSDRRSPQLVLRLPSGHAVRVYLYRGNVYLKASMARPGFWGFLRVLLRPGPAADLRERACECLRGAYGGTPWRQEDVFR